MTEHGASNDLLRSSQGSEAPHSNGSSLRLSLLFGLLAIALFALWYDYQVARPAVERSYARIAATAGEINRTATHRLVTSADVQTALGRSPSDTFMSDGFTVEAYRWNAGLPIELCGLSNDGSLTVGFKTHDYYAVYRTIGPQLIFVTHFKFGLATHELSPTQSNFVTAVGIPVEESSLDIDTDGDVD